MITKEVLSEVIKTFPDLKLQFAYLDWETDFFRFYHSQSNYNITKKTSILFITMVKDKRKFSFDIQNPTKETIIQNIKENIPLLKHIPQDKEFDDFDNDKNELIQKPIRNNIKTLTLKDKIVMLRLFSDTAKKYDFDIYGSFVCNYDKTILANSNDVVKTYESSPIMLDIKAVSNKNAVTVIDKWGSNDFTNFNKNHFLKQFENKIISATKDISDINPGIYKVILSPYAISEFIQFFIYNAHASTVYSNQSFLLDKKDKKIFPEILSIYDDPTNEEMITSPYNSDGRLLHKLPIVEKGIFKNFLVDKYYSSILNMEITGNEGSNLVMEKGSHSLDEMIASIDNGLYISNIHYMNFINFKETSVTGLTRDGTFLIKNGKISKVVNNLRFTLKIADILENITMIENKNYPVPISTNYGYFNIYSTLMPHIKTEKFHISSSTKTI